MLMVCQYRAFLLHWEPTWTETYLLITGHIFEADVEVMMTQSISDAYRRFQ